MQYKLRLLPGTFRMSGLLSFRSAKAHEYTPAYMKERIRSCPTGQLRILMVCGIGVKRIFRRFKLSSAFQLINLKGWLAFHKFEEPVCVRILQVFLLQKNEALFPIEQNHILTKCGLQ